MDELIHFSSSFFFKKKSHVAPKMMIKPQEDLTKYGYKTNREIKKSSSTITCWCTNRTY
jgi:hypothetical protein